MQRFFSSRRSRGMHFAPNRARRKRETDTFRLPDQLVQRVDECRGKIRTSGLMVNRTDVVRMLIKHPLDTVHCDATELFSRGDRASRAQKRDRVTP